jgi:Uma2 family endonuclease
MAATTQLMTVEQFRELPDTLTRVYRELRNGEPVLMGEPKAKHYKAQRQLRRLIEELAPSEALVDIEMGYRPLPEYQVWKADVAYLSAERWAQVDLDDNIRGAPELVIEVLSPSNTQSEMAQKRATCLENGSSEFWVVDQDRRRVTVSTRDGQTATYGPGDAIPMPLFGDAQIAVDDIFTR